MDALKLYMENVYLRECESRLTAISVVENNLFAEFETTVFFPEGGGQSSDIGTATISGEDFNVIQVREEGNSIIHVCERTSAKIPEIGATAILRIDWNHRFDNMQRHCGEHVLSGLFYSKYGGVNKGFHMGKDHMSIDISLEKDEMYTELTQEMIDEIELDANKVIWSNLPVTTVFLANKDDAASLSLRKDLAVENDISVVSIGNKDMAVDCVACCGTHPTSTGQIGLIKIYKIEKNKGMFRIYCEAGKRALLDYRNKHNVISELGNKYSTGPDDLIKQLEIEERKAKDVRSELNKHKQNLIKSRAADIDEELLTLRASENPDILIKEYSDLSIDELLNIGKFLKVQIPKLLILICTDQHAAVLLSDGKACDCGKLVKENAPIYNGKGGGRSDNARALFNSREYLDTFVDLLGKHLR